MTLIKTFLLGLALTAGAAFAVNLPIFQAAWDDGTIIEWVCKPGTEGAVAFRITAPDGKMKRGELPCGESV